MLTPRVIRMTDESPFNDDGSMRHEKVITFYLENEAGKKVGPFTERFSAATFTGDQFNARVDLLRRECAVMGIQ